MVIRRIQKSSPRLKGRLAGAFYFLAVVSAILVEGFVHGRMLYAVGLIPEMSFAVVTFFLWDILRPVDRKLAALAALCNLVSLAMEAFEFHFMGANVALAFHGMYCIFIGYLISKSQFLPRALRVSMAIAGIAWLTDLSIPFTNHLSPYNVLTGFAAEGLPMLWLLVIGLNVERWITQTDATSGAVTAQVEQL
jgi:hypothetical protein